MVFLELRREPGVHSRVTAGVDINNFCFFSDDRTPEGPQEHPHTSRSTLMSTQECEIDRCSPNQLEMTTNSPAMASEQSPIPHYTGQMA